MVTAAKRPITAADFFRIRIAADPQTSPDGSIVAFVLTTVSERADRYYSAIWAVPVEQGEPYPITSGLWRDHSPRWSPDGRKLAFISNRSGSAQVWVMPWGAGEAQQVTQAETRASYPTWSPDSSSIAFVGRVMEEQPRRGRSDARIITRLAYRSDAEGYDDGHRRHIFVVAAKGGEARQITAGPWNDNTPTWSPDGKAIAFVSSRGIEGGYSQVSDLWTVPAKGGTAQKVTTGNSLVANPAWSPDGRWLAYVGHDKPMDFAATPGLWIVPAQGGEACNLTVALDRPVGALPLGDVQPVHVTSSAPAWASDSRGLLFYATDAGDCHVYSVSLDCEVRRVTHGDMVCRGLSLAAKGKTLAYCATTPVNPGDIYVTAVSGGAQRQLTNVNKALLDGLDLTTPEQVSYHSADGTKVAGWVLKPPGFKERQKYPLVVNIHGGPFGCFGNLFFQELHVLAAQGYVVLYTNPRGSTGYGYPFANAAKDDFGNGDYQDIMAGVEHVLSKGYVDETRMALVGGSYGGYMTLWIAAHDHRFAAGVADRVFGDLMMQYTITHAMGMLWAEGTLGNLQQDHEKAWRFSPVAYYHQINTPMLLMGGENDYSCHIAQTEQAFSILKRRGVPTEFIRFPGANHDYSRRGRPNQRVDRLEFTVEWLARYLKSS